MNIGRTGEKNTFHGKAQKIIGNSHLCLRCINKDEKFLFPVALKDKEQLY